MTPTIAERYAPKGVYHGGTAIPKELHEHAISPLLVVDEAHVMGTWNFLELLRESWMEQGEIDFGTTIAPVIRIDSSPTSANSIVVEHDVGQAPEAVETSTRMARIRELARLSLRDWAHVFGVTHTSISDWERKDPDRIELATVLELLEEASARRPALADWLVQALPNAALRPLDLLAARQWRAFKGAFRVRSAPAPISADQLEQRRQQSLDWVTAETPITPDEE